MKGILLTALAAVLLIAPAAAEERVTIAQECASVPDCLDRIGRTIPKGAAGRILGDERKVTGILKSRFGRAARDAVLEKAIGPDAGWRSYAEELLFYWDDWAEEDVPILTRALQHNPGGVLTLVLVDIGSPAAIEAVVDDFVRTGSSQTELALLRAGPDVLRRLLPALGIPEPEGDGPPDYKDLRRREAPVSLVRNFGSRAVVIADDWIRTAKNRRESRSRRIAALRGLGAMNGYLGAKSAALRPLLRDRDKTVAKQAFETLVDTHDPSVARRFAATCRPRAAKWDEHARESFNCLQRLAGFGRNAKRAGDLLLPFLKSKNRAEQLFAIEALGLIGYRKAIPDIEEFLNATDWRFVYAAVRALGLLNSRESVPKIEAATRNHWFWELKNYGGRAVRLLVMNQPWSEVLGDRDLPQDPGGIGSYRNLFPGTRQECETNVYSYRDEMLTFEEVRDVVHDTVSLPDGELVATHMGEFGGSLVWRSRSGEEVTLVDDNTSHLFQAGENFLSIHGIAHLHTNYGFAALITRDADNRFTARQVARFPAWTFQVKRLGDNLFAGNDRSRAIIFSTEGIVDVAYCDLSAPARQKARELGWISD